MMWEKPTEQELMQRARAGAVMEAAAPAFDIILPELEARTIRLFRSIDPTYQDVDKKFDPLSLIVVNLKLRVIEEIRAEVMQTIQAGNEALKEMREIKDGGK